jgi:hypothetical protein
MKEILIESYKYVKKETGLDVSRPGNTRQMLTNDKVFDAYVTSLAESLENEADKGKFRMLAENTRTVLLENSMYQINPYESLTMPILRVFYPKLVAKEALTLSPMDKPECIKAFINAKFAPSPVNGQTTWYQAPVINTDISTGPTRGTGVTATINVPTANTGYDVLATMGLTPADAHLERDFLITGATGDSTTWTSLTVQPDVEGYFSTAITLTIAGSEVVDVLSGRVDYLSGKVFASRANPTGTPGITVFSYSVSCSLEENKVNPKIYLEVDKVRLYARDRQIQSNWTINMEQDMRALFDVSMQAEIVNLLAQQIALDIDRELVALLKNTNTKMNASFPNHTGTFQKNPPSWYTWGAKYWHENITSVLNVLSAAIYSDTHMNSGNTILCNPLDAAILEDLNGFAYTGTSAVNGEVGYTKATVTGGKWTILTSAVVDQGQMVMVYKPSNEIETICFYSPYVPAILHPYPLGATPSLTILSRYATAMVRPRGIAALTIEPGPTPAP